MRALRCMVMGLALLAALAGRPGQAADAPWDIERLMQALAKVSVGRADFVETKTIAMLEKPLVSSGQLFYVAPDKLEKRTLKPRPESMIIEGNTLVIERGRQNMTLQVDSAPELAGFVNSIRGTLAGDRRALERSFALSLEGPPQRWLMTLKPLDARMAAAVTAIRISGAQDDVKSVEILQADGDRSVMAINRISAQ
jgi:outer membrane lipoprotein-sorting protein